MTRPTFKSLYAALERLLAALTDPARRERTVIGVLFAYVLLWTLYGVLAKASQDIHFDMGEAVAWSRALAFGYHDHPPLSAVLVKLWFSVFPLTDWAYYLLAMTLPAVALWIAWRLSARWLDVEKRIAGLALLTFVPFFSFHALKFNANTVLLPFWAATAFWFLRSFETRGIAAAAFAGLFAALAMLGKYWSVTLIFGLAIAALADPRRAAYFRSPAPWVSVAIGFLVLAPHLVWLVAYDFLPFSYAVGVHGAQPFAIVAWNAFTYVTGAAAYVAVPVALTWLAARPSVAALKDTLLPTSVDRRLAATAFWAPLLLPIPLALLLGVKINSLWTIAAWTLLPVVLLSSPLIALTRRDTRRIVALAVTFPLVMVAAAPLIAIVIHRAGVTPSAAHARLLAERIEQAWRDTTDRPLRFAGGDHNLAYSAAFYLPSRPMVATRFDAPGAAADREAQIAQHGIALVCPLEQRGCVSEIEARAARAPAGRRVEVELVRQHAGIAGAPARYLIITVPPR